MKNQCEQYFLGYLPYKSELAYDLVLMSSSSPSVSYKFIPLKTYLPAIRFLRHKSSCLSCLPLFIAIITRYKSNQSNLTNCYVYYRDIIKQCVNAGNEDVVVFTGSGTTGAIHKLIHALQLTGKVVDKSVSTITNNPFKTLY